MLASRRFGGAMQTETANGNPESVFVAGGLRFRGYPFVHERISVKSIWNINHLSRRRLSTFYWRFHHWVKTIKKTSALLHDAFHDLGLKRKSRAKCLDQRWESQWMLIFAFSRFKVVLNVDRDECVGDDGQGLPWDRGEL